jgi:hypothetical protein
LPQLDDSFEKRIINTKGSILTAAIDNSEKFSATRKTKTEREIASPDAIE